MNDQKSSILGTGGAPAPAAAVAAPRAKKGRAPKAAPPAAAVPEIMWFRVMESATVPRHGGTFELPRGKEINTGSFDLATLKRAGVKLEPMDHPPAWWVEQQHKQVEALEAEDEEAGQELRKQLAARGVPGLLEDASAA